jgi:translation initiation factor IF-2
VLSTKIAAPAQRGSASAAAEQPFRTPGASAGAHDEQRKQGERPGKTQQAARPASSKRLLETPATALAVGARDDDAASRRRKARQDLTARKQRQPTRSPERQPASPAQRRRQPRHRATRSNRFRWHGAARPAGAAGQRPAAAANAAGRHDALVSTKRPRSRADNMERHQQFDTNLEISPATAATSVRLAKISNRPICVAWRFGRCFYRSVQRNRAWSA